MRPALFLLLASLAFACKHRRGPTVSEEWDSAGDKQRLNLSDLISDARGVRFLELYDDGFLLTDSLTYRFDGQQPSLLVERRYDAVPMSGEEPLVASKQVIWSLDAQKVFLNSLKTTNVRHVPTCNPYAVVDGGYGGRFFTIQDPGGHDHTFGTSDAICAPSDHDCSGPCISAAAMDAIQKTLTAIAPIPEKPQPPSAAPRPVPSPAARPIGWKR